MLSISPPQIVFTLVVFVLSVVTIFFRWTFYKYLVTLEENVKRLLNNEPRGRQHKIVEKLELRLQKASINLDQVNTAALIDQVYSREKILGFTCDKIEYWCRMFPNLLLAFGLLGTFWGITINLLSLSQTLNQTDATNVSALVAELKQPLEGMSIAFTTSLIGLFFSTILTFVNWVINTSLLKTRLISSLEDYLDNIYQPQVQGDTRLDKIVNKMVSQQDEFLTRFGSTVRDAVEQSMGKAAQQIAQGNREATQLAKQVYERFHAAAGTISAAANEFEHTIAELNAKSHIFRESAEVFERSQFPQKLSDATADLAHTQGKFSESAATLAATVTSIEKVLREVQLCNQELINLSGDIKQVNQTSLQVFELHQSNQNSLAKIIPQIKQGASGFSKAVTKLDKLEERIVQRADSLNAVEIALRQLLESVNNYTQQVNLGFLDVSQQLGSNHGILQSTVSNIEGVINQSNVKLETIVKKADSFNAVEISLRQLLESMNKYMQQVNAGFVDVSQQLGGNHRSLQSTVSNIEGVINQLSVKLETLVLDMQSILKENSSVVKEYEKVSDRLIDSINKLTEISPQKLNSIKPDANQNSQEIDDFLNIFPAE